MKHLKLFENHNYYTEIDSYEYDALRGIEEGTHLELPITDREFEMIRSWFPKLKCLKTEYWTYGNKKYHQIEITTEKETIYTVKLDDDWWVVSTIPLGENFMTGPFYKCDQLDGVKKLFQDLGLI